MKKLVLTFLLTLLELTLLYAQEYRVYTYSGQVSIRDRAGNDLSLTLDMPVSSNDFVTVAPRSSLALFDVRKSSVFVVGECSGERVGKLVSGAKDNWRMRMRSMIKGTDGSEKAYVSYKGDDPVPECVFAARQQSYSSRFQVGFELIDHLTGNPVGDILSDGQQVHFRITNQAVVPLCVGIVWLDSVGNITDCMAERSRYTIIPAESTVELKDVVIEAAPPFGTDRILLFASPEFFDLSEFEDLYYAPGNDASTGTAVGFSVKHVQIQ